MLEEDTTAHEIVKITKHSRHNYLFFFTCLNGLWGTIWSAAATRGSFDGDVVSPSTLKTGQVTAGTVSVAGH